MLPTYPALLARPFAASGDKIAIPDTGAQPGRASLAEGFPVLTQTPLTAGGIPPSRLDFNGILNMLSQFAFWQQSGGMYAWNAALSYAPPALVWGSDGKLYRCLAPSGPDVVNVGAKNPAEEGGETWWADYTAEIVEQVVSSGGGGGGELSAMLLGTLLPWRSTTLGNTLVWANGDAVYLADWPEFKAMYEAGGLAGLVLPEGTSAAARAANRGMWTVASGGAALLTPDMRGQFMRGQCPGTGSAGAWGRDEIRNITGRIENTDADPMTDSGWVSQSGAISYSTMQRYYFGPMPMGPGGYNDGFSVLNFNASRVVPTGPENVPPHVWTPMAIYMGAHI